MIATWAWNWQYYSLIFNLNIFLLMYSIYVWLKFLNFVKFIASIDLFNLKRLIYWKIYLSTFKFLKRILKWKHFFCFCLKVLINCFTFLLVRILRCLVFHPERSAGDSSTTGDCLWTLAGCICITHPAPAHDDQLVTTGPATGAPSPLWECDGQLVPASSLLVPLEAAPLSRWDKSSTKYGASLDVFHSTVRKWG